MRLLVFSKMFQRLPLERFGELAAEMGFEGVDLTVRPGGYVPPRRVETELPKAVETLEARGLSVPMITTSITSCEDPYAEAVFKTASECGVRYLKLGYWRYEGFGRLKTQIEEVRRRLEEIQELSRRYGVTAAVHIHSGMYLTAEPMVVAEILEGFDPDLVGAYIDPGHMAVEGGLAGWLMGLDVLSDKIRMVAVKDFAWFKEGNSWRVKVVPLGKGLVPWRKVFDILRRIGFEGPVSLHSEYEDLTLPRLIEQTRRDLRYVKDILESL